MNLTDDLTTSTVLELTDTKGTSKENLPRKCLISFESKTYIMYTGIR